MLELAILTCLEASQLISRIERNTDVPLNIREELVQTVKERSECPNVNV